MPPTSVLLLICLFGGTYAQGPTTKDVTIIEINLETLPKVSFTLGNVADAPIGTDFILTVQTVGEPSNIEEYVMDPIFTPADNCDNTVNCHVEFTAEFTEKKDLPLIFILTGEHTEKEDIIVKGIEKITLPKIPTDLTANSAGIALRIKQDLSTWSIHDVDAHTSVNLKCKTDGPCYALYADDAIPTSLAICAFTDTTGIPVVVKSFTATPLKTDADDPVSIILDYGNDPSSGLLIAGTAGPKSEAVIYKDTGAITSICWDATATCVSDPAYTPGNDVLHIILIDVANDGIPTNSKTHQFKDIKLNVFKLEATVLEARWTQTVKKYTAFRTKTGGGADAENNFLTVNVDCTESHGFCYAYYVNMATDGVNTVTITPKIPVLNTPNDLNKIISKEFKMNSLSTPRVSKNSIQNMTIESQYTQSSGNLEMNICVSHNSTISLDGTQLEVVLISDSNQWKRIINGSLHQVEQRGCYSTSFVLKPDKDLHSSATALVIQRDVSSNEVISFYRSDFNLPALRSIKPEVDNGSEESTSTLAIVGAAIAGIACLMALVAAAVMFVMKIKRDNDGLQYPLPRTNIEDSSYIHGLDNPIPTM